MAIKELLMGSTMVLKVKTGQDKNGKDIIKKQRFGKLDLNAKDEDVYAISEMLKGVSKYPIMSTSKDNVLDVVME